jgi:glutamine synthetase
MPHPRMTQESIMATTNKMAGNGMVEMFGSRVFNLKTMRNYLSEKAYQSITSTLLKGETLDPSISDEVADAMKTWAMEKGATHFSHWFQPLTGATAEKQEAFVQPDGEGGILTTFSGKELIQGEPDASSFPSGGLRATFEARGYTAWDPTSPAFVKEGPNNSVVLCIPTVFCSYHGEALDKKTPLLRSQNALAKQIVRLAKLFKVPGTARPYGTLGAEQEYFLVDREFFNARPDLVQTGRTLFGKRSARHQQMEDHYFGHIKPRVIAFMTEVDSELWKLGVPAKTRHNEVSPAQFEIAPVFEEQNLAVDHNMVVMQVLREVAERHNFACLLHEKPFAGVNGSGKHNNWSISGPDGKNWLSPGANPHDNAKFLTMIAAIMKGVDTYAPILRATVASAGNDHRLGANEAPPAIISIFLGEQLTDMIAQIEKGGNAKTSTKGGSIQIGISGLPDLPRDATDRNRTSPMAFTGNKFEFRAVGSNMSCAGSNVALNTMVAWAIDEICTALEKKLAGGAEFNAALQELIRGIVRDHKRILFDGDNYTEAWRKEAARRGLQNLTATPAALKELVTPSAIALFERYGVLTARELKARYEAYLHAYEHTVALEANCALTMANTMILPAGMACERDLAATLAAGRGLSAHAGLRKIAKSVAKHVDELVAAIAQMEKALDGHESARILAAMTALRKAGDALEEHVPADLWPLPTYGEMFFLL